MLLASMLRVSSFSTMPSMEESVASFWVIELVLLYPAALLLYIVVSHVDNVCM